MILLITLPPVETVVAAVELRDVHPSGREHLKSRVYAPGFGAPPRHLALQIALLVALLAALVGVVNAFRMMRLPDPLPSAATEGTVVG
jgi:hypothetical protein